jgi:hypothetical protein
VAGRSPARRVRELVLRSGEGSGALRGVVNSQRPSVESRPPGPGRGVRLPEIPTRRARPLTRVTNLMILGDRKDENYKLALAIEVWELQMAEWQRNVRLGPAPRNPEPLKLDPRVVTAVANAVRTWLECKDSVAEPPAARSTGGSRAGYGGRSSTSPPSRWPHARPFRAPARLAFCRTLAPATSNAIVAAFRCRQSSHLLGCRRVVFLEARGRQARDAVAR